MLTVLSFDEESLFLAFVYYIIFDYTLDGICKTVAEIEINST